MRYLAEIRRPVPFLSIYAIFKTLITPGCEVFKWPKMKDLPAEAEETRRILLFDPANNYM